MGNMYKETVERKRVPVLFFILILLVLGLYLLQLIKGIKINGYEIQTAFSIIINSFIIAIILFELLKCKVRYAYFIIADQFIIHRINGNCDKVVENIKLKDILYFGKSKLLTTKITIATSKYTCSMLKVNTYCCKYKKGNKIKKFYFEPSPQLITKLDYLVKRRL